MKFIMLLPMILGGGAVAFMVGLSLWDELMAFADHAARNPAPQPTPLTPPALPLPAVPAGWTITARI